MATIIKKYNKKGELTRYKFKCCVGRDENGKQILRTKSVVPPAGLTPAKQRKEIQRMAAEWEKEQKSAFNAGITTENKDRITFASFVNNHWFPDHVQDGTHTPSSITFYNQMAGISLEYFGDKKLLSHVDAENVKRFVKYLNVSARTKAGKPYSSTSVAHAFGTLRSILEYARRMHYIRSNPCDDLSARDKPHRERHNVDFLSVEDVVVYCECLGNETLFWRCFQVLLITTGLRRGEAVGLQWQDIDEREQTITVQRNVTVDKDSPLKYNIGKTKGKETRVVHITDRVLNLLLELKEEQMHRYKKIENTYYIFCRDATPSMPIYPTTPTRWQSNFVKRNHLRDVSPHDLRHTAATLALEGGADIKQVQELLGHKDPKITMLFYLGVSDERKRSTVAGIEAVIENARSRKRA